MLGISRALEWGGFSTVGCVIVFDAGFQLQFSSVYVYSLSKSMKNITWHNARSVSSVERFLSAAVVVACDCGWLSPNWGPLYHTPRLFAVKKEHMPDEQILNIWTEPLGLLRLVKRFRSNSLRSPSDPLVWLQALNHGAAMYRNES